MTYVLHNALCDASLKMLSERDRVFEMYYEDNMSIRALAKMYDTNTGVIKYFFKVHGQKLDQERLRYPIRTRHVHDAKDVIIYLYQEKKMTATEIAKQYKVSDSCIGKLLRRENIETRRGNPLQIKHTIAWENQSKIVSMYEDDEMTLKQIGSVFNVSYQTIKRVLVHNGVQMRGGKPNYENVRKAWADQEKIKYDMTVNGRHYNDIANEYGVSAKTIYKIAKLKDQNNDDDTDNTNTG